MTFPLPNVDYGNGNDMVWYAAYGSNLSEERLNCYIRGGTPDGASERQRGMQDNTAPLINTDYSIPHELYFADYTEGWKGAVAFISPDSSMEYKTYCRIYLIKRKQFIELLSHENGDFDCNIMDKYDQLDNSRRFVAYPDSWYGLVLNVGEWAGYPVYTFTREADYRQLRQKPSVEYLNTIINGLVECYPYMLKRNPLKKDSDLISYLYKATQGAYSEQEIQTSFESYEKAFIEKKRTSDSLFLVHPTDDRKETAREFIIQLSEKTRGKLEVDIGDTLIVSSLHNYSYCIDEKREFEALAKLNIVDEDPEDHVVRMDQKLRVAIGVRKGDWVTLRKASDIKKLGLAKFWEKIIGTQPQLMRVHQATFEDMEIPIVRIPSTTFEAMGTQPGHFLSIQSTKGCTRARAGTLSIETWSQRAELMKAEKETVLNPRKVLCLDRLEGGTVGNDIPPIFMDNDLRRELQVKPCDCVRVVRNVKDSIFAKLHLAALPLTFAMIGFAISLDFNNITKIAIITVGMLLSVLALYTQVRAEVK